jgi:hypothetical protein
MSIRIFKTGDKILIVSILIIAGVFFGFKALQHDSSGNLIAVVSQDGEEIETVNLTKLEDSQTIVIEEPLHQVILAERGRIRFEESDCPNQNCVDTGWLTKAGDKAVCLPNKVVITIEGEGESEVDIFAY